MYDPSAPVGRLVAVHAGAPGPGPARLEPGRSDVLLVVDGVPVGDLPAGSRLRVGAEALVELGEPAEGAPPAGQTPARVQEADQEDARAIEILAGGPVRPGDPVTLEAVALPLTDVLDLHSFRPEEIPRVVAEYLDEARRAGLDEVRIVHGRGRGVQRAVVRRLLSETPGVAGFADAPPTRGGWGATVVRLTPPRAAAPPG